MKSLFFALICGLTLTSAATASAQTTATEHHEPAGARVVYFDEKGQHSESAELDKYEIRRCRVLGVITAAEAHMIRQRKRVAQRQENAYLKAEAAKLHNEDTSLATR